MASEREQSEASFAFHGEYRDRIMRATEIEVDSSEVIIAHYLLVDAIAGFGWEFFEELDVERLKRLCRWLRGLLELEVELEDDGWLLGRTWWSQQLCGCQ